MARILIIRKHKTNNMKRYYILAFYILLVAGTATAQEETISLTLQQAIEIAQEHSPQAQAARHTYRAAYWNYRFFRANYYGYRFRDRPFRQTSSQAMLRSENGGEKTGRGDE